MDAQALIIIPARYDSSRFPGKPLASIRGISMIERVWRIAQACEQADAVFIATDSEAIATHAQTFGAKVLMTAPDCYTGTDRVAQAAAHLADETTIIVGLQGDAVLTPPWVVDALILQMKKNPQQEIATPAVKLQGEALQAFLNHKKISPSSGTTVVFDKTGKALYFSKQPIPFLREVTPGAALFRHIGLYAYRYAALKRLQTLAPTPLEKLEKLEQLRALENDIPLQVVVVDYQGRSHGSVDTEHDISVIEEIISKEGELIL